MLSPGSASFWIDRLRAGDHLAAQNLWEDWRIPALQRCFWYRPSSRSSPAGYRFSPRPIPRQGARKPGGRREPQGNEMPRPREQEMMA
jgi:hypothetical protein